MEMVAVGDELLSGLVLNSNAARLADALAAVGLGIEQVTEVGDDLDGIVAVVSAAAARADAVVVSGGLGATSDDLTRDALAAAAGVGMDRDPAVEERIREIYAAYGTPVPDLAYRQADVPRGAALLPNPRGSAPGLRLTLGRAVVWALPGVPVELEAMLGPVAAEIAGLAGEVAAPATAMVRVALEGEFAVAAALTELEARDAGRVRYAYLAEPGDLRIRLTGPDAALVGAAAADVAARLGPAAYAVAPGGAPGLDEVVHGLLAAAGATVAVAESLTGGGLAAALTDMAGASGTFRGGAVVYATDTKGDLGVDRALLAARGPVDPEVAGQLAVAARARFGTTYGLGTTGVAGPDPVGEHPVGTVFVGLAGPAGVTIVRPALHGDRARIRRLAVVHALDLLRRELSGMPRRADTMR